MSERIVSAQTVERPLNGPGGHSFGQTHSGTRVTTEAGNSYLIHAPGANRGSVVTNASNMSNRWSVVRDLNIAEPTTVGALHRAGGSSYANGLCHGHTARHAEFLGTRSADADAAFRVWDPSERSRPLNMSSNYGLSTRQSTVGMSGSAYFQNVSQSLFNF
eukprot:g11705.t1